MASRKQKEINELLRRELSRIILYELSDPRLGFTTVTRVRIAGDYRSAKVYVTVRGEDEDKRRTLDALRHARGHMQALIADRIKLRWTPVLEFIQDQEMVDALRVNRILDEMSDEESPGAHSAAEEADDGADIVDSHGGTEEGAGSQETT